MFEACPIYDTPGTGLKDAILYPSDSVVQLMFNSILARQEAYSNYCSGSNGECPIASTGLCKTRTLGKDSDSSMLLAYINSYYDASIFPGIEIHPDEMNSDLKKYY